MLYHPFTVVNVELSMKSKRNKLVTSVITLWVLTLVLTVFVFAEKVHEGHLPERNDRGVLALITLLGISGGILTRTRPTSLPAGKNTDSYQINKYNLIDSISQRSPDQMMMAPITCMPSM
jgi:hypothetical protein